MADITNLFRATVKSVRVRLKASNKHESEYGHGGETSKAVDQSILKVKTKSKSDFEKKAQSVVEGITRLRQFLMQYRKDYLAMGRHTVPGKNTMTDSERDQIDSDAQAYMRTCSEAIKQLKALEKGHLQTKEHRDCVLELMEDYLNAPGIIEGAMEEAMESGSVQPIHLLLLITFEESVCKVYSEQKAVRVKRVVDRKRIGRLEPEKRRHESFVSHVNVRENKEKEAHGGLTSAESTCNKSERSENDIAVELAKDSNEYDLDDQLSPEDMQMFEQENKQLYEDMNTMRDEVKQIEGRVVEISKLQEIFADKVLEQDVKVDRISDTVSGTTDNIKEANEEIREAMKSNAGLRVWILFFLIVCTFSLLFLDWYSP